MPGLGTLVNMITIAIGGTIGAIAGDRFPLRVRDGVVRALGLATVIIGLSITLGALTQLNEEGGFLTKYGVIIFAGSLIVGTLIGELLRLEDWLERFGEVLSAGAHKIPFFAKGGSNSEVAADSHDMVEGFMTASLLFCVGAMTILGSIQDGLGNPQTLFLKAMLDGFMALFLASSLGAGVLLSIVPIFIVQGSIALLSFLAGAVVPEVAIIGIELAGGALIAAVGLNFLLSKRLPVGNMLPAIAIAAVLCWILG